MSDFHAPQSGNEHLHLTELSQGTREALQDSARRNGRTVHDEAEHILKTHLAASGEAEA